MKFIEIPTLRCHLKGLTFILIKSKKKTYIESRIKILTLVGVKIKNVQLFITLDKLYKKNKNKIEKLSKFK